MEPALECTAALWSSETVIIDSHGLMSAYRADAESRGAMVAPRTAFAGARWSGVMWEVMTQGDDATTIQARWLVNCSGLDAQRVAKAMDGFPAAGIPTLHVAKGHYFSLAAPSPFSRLVYPRPTDGGLGIHLTLDLAGQARFGPDVEWIADASAPFDYAVDAMRAPSFARDIRRYWPALPDGALQPAYAGIRAKLSGPGEPAADFRIDGPAVHGVPGVVQCLGIESPGLTASLAIGVHVLALLPRHGTDRGAAHATKGGSNCRCNRRRRRREPDNLLTVIELAYGMTRAHPFPHARVTSTYPSSDPTCAELQASPSARLPWTRITSVGSRMRSRIAALTAPMCGRMASSGSATAACRSWTSRTLAPAPCASRRRTAASP